MRIPRSVGEGSGTLPRGCRLAERGDLLLRKRRTIGQDGALDMLITIETEAGDLAHARDDYGKLTDLAQTHPDSSFRLGLSS